MKDNNSCLIETEHVSIDVTMLYDVSGNDMNFIYSTVRAFLKNMPDTLNKLEQSLLMQDWDNVYKLSHQARSALSIVKIDELFAWMTQVENNAKNKTSLNSIPDLINRIKEKYVFAEVILNERFKA